MPTTMLAGAVLALIIGIVLYAVSKKQREDNGEWSGALQWGYLLMMVGVFGLLSFAMSFTAVLLLFVVFTFAVWLWHKKQLKANPRGQDNNHFTDYMSGFFPIITVVFVLRTFVAEPFQIPSSSMRPGLVVGDFILVNKSAYGIRVPVLNNVLINTGSVQHGDVAVFNYPENTRINYIKRVVGLPGDTVEYKDKMLSVNGQPVTDSDKNIDYYHYTEMVPGLGPVQIDAEQYRETLGAHEFNILKMPQQPPVIMQGVRANFPHRDQCEYAADGSGFKCTVPAGQYLMMGDNRDNSEDSRYWGFVDDKLMVGKAFFVWMNFGDMSRIGTQIR